jgi:hypothetical protein
MTLGGLRPFFVYILNAQSGLKEWKDGFNTANIPSNILDGAYHVEVGQISGLPASQLVHGFTAPITVRLFFKGYRDPQAVKDAALDKADVILNAVLRPSVRLQTDGLKDVRPVSIRPIPLDQSNDNALILELVFECILNYRFS